MNSVVFSSRVFISSRQIIIILPTAGCPAVEVKAAD
jgi:hypothetical protein